MPKLTSIKVSLNLPYLGGIEGTWEPDETEKKAAWEMYVELVTRVPIVELQSDEGYIREAITSLYSLFSTTRNILREYGPVIAQPKGDSDISFAYLAVAILNNVLRPFLAIWHPLLLHHESLKPTSVSPIEHEKQWDKITELREDLNVTRIVLIDYANLLAEVADVPSLIFESENS